MQKTITKHKKAPAAIPMQTTEAVPAKEMEDSEDGEGTLEVDDEDNEMEDRVPLEEKDVLDTELNAVLPEDLTAQDPAVLKSMEISSHFYFLFCSFYFHYYFVSCFSQSFVRSWLTCSFYASLKAAKERLKAELEELKAELEEAGETELLM